MRGAERGFTLVEVLVALAVLLAVLAPLYDLFALGARAGDRAQDQGRALLAAQSFMDMLLADPALAAGERTEEAGDGVARRAAIRPRPDLAPPSGTGMALLPLEVTVEVAWTEAGRTRQLSLTGLTLREAPP